VIQFYDLVFNQMGNLQYIEFNHGDLVITGFAPLATADSATFTINIPLGFSTLTPLMAGPLITITGVGPTVFSTQYWQLTTVALGQYTFTFYFPIVVTGNGHIFRQLLMLTP
jgi:hypothetical protein